MSLVDFAKTAGKLKNVKRSGWILAGIKNPESVADHSFRLAVLAMVIGEKFNLNADKMIKMALIDDLAESIVGDLVIERGDKIIQSRKDQQTKEEQALKTIFSDLDNGKNYLKLWKEAQAGKTPEAQIVRQLDKLEMAFQALEYEGITDSAKLDEFWQNARKHVKDLRLLQVLDDIELQR